MIDNNEPKVNWTITADNITVNYSGQTHIVPRNEELGKKLYQAIKEKNFSTIPDIVSIAKGVKEYSNGEFEIVDGDLLLGGQRVPSQLAKKILQFKEEGLPYEPLVKFAEKLLQNPSYRAVNELFQFLEHNDIPICEDGDMICFKRVKENFKDIYSGKVNNSPGTVVKMPRNQVDEDQHNLCSHGYHCGGAEYTHNHYASNNPETDKMLEVKVNPANVVSVPVDHDNGKMRVCEYLVLQEVDLKGSGFDGERIRGLDLDAQDNESDDDWIDEESSEEEESSYWLDEEESSEKKTEDKPIVNFKHPHSDPVDPYYDDESSEETDPWDNHND